LIDYATWMVDSTSVRVSRAAAGAPNTETSKKGSCGPARSRPWTLPERIDDEDSPGLRLRRCTTGGLSVGGAAPRFESIQAPDAHPGGALGGPEHGLAAW
jgi:hypothetical protein